MATTRTALPLLGFTLLLAACQQAQTPTPRAAQETTQRTEATQDQKAAAPAKETHEAPEKPNSAWPLLVVHKSPTCGCCKLWIEHMQAEGFEVDVRDTQDMESVKRRLGVPPGQVSCHTAEIIGYFVEGHVPGQDVKKLLTERPPQAIGLAVPGMPLGSPGMEAGNVRQPYDTMLIGKNGPAVFARHNISPE